MSEAPKFVGRPGSLFSRLADSSRYFRISPRSASSPGAGRREGDAAALRVEADDLHLDLLARGERLRRPGVPCGRPVSEFGMRPVRPISRRTKTPNGATFSTSPVDDRALGHLRREPFPRVGRRDLAEREGEAAVLLVDLAHPARRPPGRRRPDGSFRSTPGGSWETWTRPSMPGSISMKRPKSAWRATGFVNGRAGRDPLRRGPPTGPSRAPSWRARSASPRSRPW